MSGDKELFEMMGKRGTSANQLPECQELAIVPRSLAQTAQKLAPLDARIQKLREHMPMIVTGMILLSFLIGVAL